MLPLVCIDIDGTLVGASGIPTPRVLHAIKQAQSRGQKLAINTARPGFAKAFHYAEILEPNGWHIFQAGASIIHTKSSETYDIPLDSSVISHVKMLASTNNWTVELYSNTDYVCFVDSPEGRDHAKLLGVSFSEHFDTTLKENNQPTDRVVRCQFVIANKNVPGLIRSLPNTVSYGFAESPIMPDISFVSITTKGISKASGVARIAEFYGVDLASVMVIGDGDNDAPALKIAGHGVAMGNAHPDCLAAARHIVRSVDEDGVAEALELSAILD